jgi:hypothetical protein
MDKDLRASFSGVSRNSDPSQPMKEPIDRDDFHGSQNLEKKQP